jgi:hypothetical protein
VPDEILTTATPLQPDRITGINTGPVDAVPGDGEDAPHGGSEADTRACLNSSCAVLDAGGDGLTPMRLLSSLLKHEKIIGECQALLDEAGEDKPEALATAQKLAWTYYDAYLEIRKLASAEVHQQLRNFVQSAETHSYVMKIGHSGEFLNSFDETYWSKVMTCLFFRCGCMESKTLKGRAWAKVLLSRVDFHGWALSNDYAACIYNIDIRRKQMYGVARVSQQGLSEIISGTHSH